MRSNKVPETHIKGICLFLYLYLYLSPIYIDINKAGDKYVYNPASIPDISIAVCLKVPPIKVKKSNKLTYS